MRKLCAGSSSFSEMAIFDTVSRIFFLKRSLYGEMHSGISLKSLPNTSLSVSTISAGKISMPESLAAGYSSVITKLPSSKRLGVTSNAKSLLSDSILFIFSLKLSPGVRNSSYQIAISRHSGFLCMSFMSSFA